LLGNLVYQNEDLQWALKSRVDSVQPETESSVQAEVKGNF
jgi:hypothetical protein